MMLDAYAIQVWIDGEWQYAFTTGVMEGALNYVPYTEALVYMAEAERHGDVTRIVDVRGTEVDVIR